MKKTMEIPCSVFERLVEVGDTLQGLQDEIEDILIAGDAELLARLQAARESHRAGQVKPFDQLRRRA